MNATAVFPDGRQFVQLTNASGQWRNIDGSHDFYVTIEHVEYQPTLGEQWLAQRGVAK